MRVGFYNKEEGGYTGLSVGQIPPDVPDDIAALVDWNDDWGTLGGGFDTNTEWVGADKIYIWSDALSKYVRADEGGAQYLKAYPADGSTVRQPPINIIPEPATVGLIGLGLAGIAASAYNSRRKRNK